jgi:hypothetical protein
VVGLLLDAPLLVHWLRSGLRLESLSYPAVLGLTLIGLGFQLFTFTLLFLIVANDHRTRQEPS